MDRRDDEQSRERLVDHRVGHGGEAPHRRTQAVLRPVARGLDASDYAGGGFVDRGTWLRGVRDIGVRLRASVFPDARSKARRLSVAMALRDQRTPIHLPNSRGVGASNAVDEISVQEEV